MSGQLPYEEMDKQFNDLPLPDEQASWQKMKDKLDKDDDNDRIIPPVLLRSCLGWGILLVGLTVAWLVIRPEKWWNENSKAEQTSSSDKTQKKVNKETPDKKSYTTSKPNINRENPVEKTNTVSGPLNKAGGTGIVVVPKRNEKIPFGESPAIAQNKKRISTNIIQGKNRRDQPQNQKPVSRNEDQIQEEPTKISSNEITNHKDNSRNSDTVLISTDQQVPAPKDTAKKDSTIQSQDSTGQKRTKQPQKKLFLVAGVGEQQLIPIAGQTSVPYSHYGRKGSLSDYVPSVFVQLQKEKKWFILGEFRFGAAQSVKEFSYNRKTKYDTASMNVTITNMRLKKTYYHQLPLSFNYYLKPNLSVGVGGMYSRFYGAITEKETTTWNTTTNATSTFKQIIPIRHFTDSFLYKTQVHVLVQADYQWRKFSFGLRYTKDIQPYIKYTKPDGTIDKEKNQSLQFMVRYRLWQSGKF